jgi:hypothetical protein
MTTKKRPLNSGFGSTTSAREVLADCDLSLEDY